ncbi:U3 snoRNP protein [Balamuthia mandrillaris]
MSNKNNKKRQRRVAAATGGEELAEERKEQTEASSSSKEEEAAAVETFIPVLKTEAPSQSATQQKGFKRRKKNKVEYWEQPRPLSERDLEEEAELEELVFGKLGDVIDDLGHEEEEEEEENQKEEAQEESEDEEDDEVKAENELTFWEDTKGSKEEEEGKKRTKQSKENKKKKGKAGQEEDNGLKPAWQDADDEALRVNIGDSARAKKLRKKEKEVVISGEEYSRRLRAKFEELNHQTPGGPEWAKLPEQKDSDSEADSAEEEDDSVLRTTKRLASYSSDRLPQSFLRITRLKDANQHDRSKAAIQSVNFHPNGQLLLTAGYDKTLRIFQVDGKRNPKMQSVFFEDTPIHKASFTPDGKEAIVVGRRKWFYSYDIVSGKINKVANIMGRQEKSLEHCWVSPDNNYLAFAGKNGYIILVSNRSKKWVADLKMNGFVRTLAFSPDSRSLLSSGADGLVYEWDMRTHRCRRTWHDEGGSKGTALGLSPDGSYIATGSESGVVNIYNSNDTQQNAHPKPLKAIMNLTTSTNVLKFNSDSQLLAMTSRQKRDGGLKMVHVPSFTVFPNWPHARTPLNYISDLDFSPNSGYMAIGNDKGRVLLYRLNHYDTA